MTNERKGITKMTMRPMYKKCGYCKKIFSYNPSVGNLGLRCPKCGKNLMAPGSTLPLTEKDYQKIWKRYGRI